TILHLGLSFRGTAIAAAISKNVLKLKGDFDERVHIYVYDDPIRNTLLSEVINHRHENVKYLPGIKLPRNLVAVNDLLEAAQNADILIFSMPHTFVKSYCNILAGNVKETAFAVSMIKGLMQERDDEMDLVSETISDRLEIPCYSMMSAHSSMEMAQGKLCEVTVGCDDAFHAQLLTAVLQTNNCRVISIDDVSGVELCGTLNEIVSVGAGFVDGLHLGDNTRVAAIHLCVKEMMRFIKTFFPSAKMSTFYETCGIANSVAATYVDKNVNYAQSFITTGKTFEEMEMTFLHGRKLLGPVVAADVNAFLEKALMQHEFPLFTAIHRVCQNEAPPEIILDALRNHPDLSSSSISHLLSTETAPAQENVDQMLDQVAAALPKLRSCLDKILIEAKSPNFKNLKVMDDWGQVDEHKVEQLGLQVSPTSTEDIPSQLSAEASRIRDEIKKGNVQVGFKMDASEGGRHIRLLLQESPETHHCTNESVISSGLDKGDSELSNGHFLDSSPEYIANKGISTDNTMNDSPDVLDLSNENTRIPHETTLKVHESLIKSIRQTIEALGNKKKMDNLFAESRMEDEESPFARFHDDENQSPDEATEMRQPEMKAGTETLQEHMLSASDEKSLRSEQENPVDLRLHDDVEAALDEVAVLDHRDHCFTNESTELDDLLLWQKLKSDPQEDSPKLSEMGDSTNERMEVLELETDPELDSRKLFETGNPQNYESSTKESTKLEELLRLQKVKWDPEEDCPKLSEVEDSAAWADIDKQESLPDVDKTELLVREKDEQRLVTVGNRKPKQNLNEVNVRHFRNKKSDDDGHHEWDWMLNHKFDTEPLDHERDETLSKSDQEGLERLNVQLQEALQRDWDEMITSKDDAPNQEQGRDMDLETESDNKRITHEPAIPLPLKLPTPKRHYREGTPDTHIQPGNVPSPMRESKPRKPKKLQPHRSMPPVEFGEVPEDRQPEEVTLDQSEPEPGNVPPPSKEFQPHRTAPPVELGEVPETMHLEETSDQLSKGKSEALRPPSKEKLSASELSETQETTTSKPDEKREYKNNQKSQVSRTGRDANSLIRKGRDRQVDYRGQNPFNVDPFLESKLTLDTSHDRDIGKDGVSHQRRKVVVSPPFNPPLNPRVRVPRPPFDVRDHEYHTMVARPAISPLAVATKWPLLPKTLKHPLVATIQVKQLAALPKQVPIASRSLLEIPSGMPRTPTLTRILCALQIGLLASYLARFKK
ncbi:hypothetical protein KR054_008826, partial [Drosophila jambulina]